MKNLDLSKDTNTGEHFKNIGIGCNAGKANGYLGDRTKKTTVVNLKYKPYTKYIGRHNRRYNDQVRENKFGNPYMIGPDGTREDVIAKHKKDFYNNPQLQEAVWIELRGGTLGCFCKPLACHGDTYVEYIENRERQNNGTSQDSV